MKRILVDITDLEAWNGSYGGIQRVIYMVTSRLLDLKDVTFIAFDKEEKSFYHTNLHVPGKDKGQAFPASVEVTMDVPSSNFFHRIYMRVKRYKAVRSVGQRAKSLISKPVEVSNHIERDWVGFTKDDTVLILGMAWEYTGLEQALTDAREQSNCKVVQLVYDLIICLYPHLHHPANYKPYMNYMRSVLQNSDGLLSISKSTKKDINTFAKREGLKAPSVTVIRLGDEIKTVTENSIRPSIDGLASDFILCVGTVEVRKNHTLLYYAYKLAASRGIKLPQLIVVGGSGWYSGDIQYLIATDPDMKDHIKVVHGLSDEELVWLYENCTYTVYPSIYEGWGLPIAESLAYGKLCLASNSSSMQEIAGDIIEYFSPFDSAECMEAIQKYMVRKELRIAEQRIEKMYKITSWQETANTIYTVLRK